MHVEREKIILVGVILPNKTEEAFWNSMNELHSLAKTANGEVVDELIQKLERVNQASFIGSGKLEELATLVEMHEADVVIFNSELSATQVRNISKAVDARIIDRTQLILDIFAMRAKSKEGNCKSHTRNINICYQDLADKVFPYQNLEEVLVQEGLVNPN